MKPLCPMQKLNAGHRNPYIKEKMDLDIQVQKLKLIKIQLSYSERYAWKDKIIQILTAEKLLAFKNRC